MTISRLRCHLPGGAGARGGDRRQAASNNHTPMSPTAKPRSRPRP